MMIHSMYNQEIGNLETVNFYIRMYERKRILIKEELRDQNYIKRKVQDMGLCNNLQAHALKNMHMTEHDE